MRRIIDSHIHLDEYSFEELADLVNSFSTDHIKALVTVSNNLESAKVNLSLAQAYESIVAAFGYHPEQRLPNEQEIERLLTFIELNQDEMIAIGEVGLPYYLRKEDHTIDRRPYVELLETFIQQAAIYKKPIILHAIYDDVPIVIDLLEKHSIKKAQLHWFK